MQLKNKRHLVPLLPLFSVLFLILSAYIDSARLSETRDAYLSFVILQFLTFILPAVFFCKAKGEDYIFKLKLRLMGLEKTVFLIFSVLVMITAMTGVELLLRHMGLSDGLFAHSVYTLYGRTMPEFGGNVYDTLYTTVVFAILPALTEEFMFRSVLYTEYESAGAPAAILLTSFLYALLDMSVVSFIPSFVGGLLLGFSLYVTGSIVAPIVIHIVYNLYGLFMEEYIWAFIAKPENETFFIFILVCTLLLSAVMMLSQAERVIYDKGMRDEPRPGYLTKALRAPFGGLKAFLRNALSPAYVGCFALFVLRVTGVI